MMNTIEVGDRKFEISITNERINERIKLIAAQINAEYEDKRPIFVGVLNGSFLFMADLLKEVNIPCEVAFMKVSSYKGTTSSGEMKEVFGLPENLKDRNLILVEDIVDTGFTLKYILEKVYLQQPASVRVCSLLFKPEAILSPIQELEYIGFEIPNEFVVGYGLDYDELGRNLKHIYRTIS
ncbi:hypoxanthine phosphoribosyltransferase [Pedobacter cryoconitis]|uniref:Hypoxanthine phosphoribosyltransferase n=1 Tax=Pedobacter cryoconitis TaxID=188932 RepID=A0A7X0MI64_9SPHI|nr:hypoxanthine phosphoribosyltransferase [Pedobacter cryoconitis]MBB6499606.1 hypoxanthine phosphoribosyltransferase [Pedobacter cryoconitis]